MRAHNSYSMLNPAQFKNWHSAIYSIGVHLVVLAFLPSLIKDLSFKKFNDKKPALIHFVEVPKKPEVVPPVEPKAKPMEQVLAQPVKRDIMPVVEPKAVSPVASELVPQVASAMIKPLARTIADIQAKAFPVANSEVSLAPAASSSVRLMAGYSGKVDTSMQAKAFPVANSEVSLAPAASSSVRLMAGYSGKVDTSQVRPRVFGEFSDNGAVTAVRPVMTATHVPEPVSARPLAPASVEETQIPKEDLQGIEDGFAMLIREKIAVAKAYPASARQAGQEGKVLVAFALTRDGSIIDLAVQRTSGFERLDEAAKEAVKKAAPYPPIPEKLKRDSISFKLPISFNLK